MSYKDILFHAFSGDAGEAVQTAAFGLAKKQGAQITGISVVNNTPISAFAIPYMPTDLGDSYLDGARSVAKSLQADIEEAGRKAEIRIEWRYVEGDIRGIVNLHSRYTDLVILSQGAGEFIPDGPPLNLPEDLILSTAKPILSVPWHGDFSNIGQNVLVAWNASAQSSRAVHDALPILTRADNVRVLTIGPEDSHHIPGAEITAHLTRHGANAEAEHVVKEGSSTGDTILNYARNMNADLIVCGGWGHSRMLETVMGGVTKHLLRHIHVPVLMSH